jgi:TRAP-type uncharacterized transport system substrate-binding protein
MIRAGLKVHFSGLAGLFLASVLPMPVSGQSPPKLEHCQRGKQQEGIYRLATGPIGGSYVKFGQLLKKLAPPDMKIAPCLTDGSLENLKLLSQGDVEFALAQQDLLHVGWSQEAPPKFAQDSWPKNFDDIRLVRWLYSERLQIIAGPHSYVSSLSDVTKQPFWLGPERGGTYATAVEVLRASGMSLEEIQKKARTDGDFDTANTRLLDGTVPVIFRTTPVPTHYKADLQVPCKTHFGREKQREPSASSTPDDNPLNLTCLFKSEPEVRLVGLDGAILKRLKQNPSYVVAPIYRNTYPNQNDGIMTIGMQAALITRDTVAESAVSELFDLLDSSGVKTQIQDAMNIRLDLLDKKLDPTLDDDESMLIDAVHPVVRDRLTASFADRYGKLGELGLGMLVLLYLSLRHRGFRNMLGNNANYVVTASMLVLACGFFGFVLWIIEGRFTSGFENPLVAAWSLIVYFAQGLKTEALVTSQGQFSALLALAVIATLVHTLNSDVLEKTISTCTRAVQRMFQDNTKVADMPTLTPIAVSPVNGETRPNAKDTAARGAAN